MVQEFLIALGSNLGSTSGNPLDTLESAFSELVSRGATVVQQSRYYATPCFPAGAGPDYVNACARVNLEGNPDELLRIMHEIEADFDRARVQRWGSRTLDLDLIAMADVVLPDSETHNRWLSLPLEEQMTASPDQLILPHPRLQDRAFVLVPLADVAPDWRHPVLGKTVLEMRDSLPAEHLSEVVPIAR